MQSSVISHIDYDPKKKSLRVFFHSGVAYKYKKVPLSIFEAFQKANSKGSFLNQEIKDRFEFEQFK